MISNWINKWRNTDDGIGPIGLEFAQKGVNAVQLCRQHSGTVVIREYNSVHYPEHFQLSAFSPKAFNQLLQQIFKGKQFSGRQIDRMA
jgi:hypothetical protein